TAPLIWRIATACSSGVMSCQRLSLLIWSPSLAAGNAMRSQLVIHAAEFSADGRSHCRFAVPASKKKRTYGPPPPTRDQSPLPLPRLSPLLPSHCEQRGEKP